MEDTIKKKKSIALFVIIGVALVLVTVIVLIVVKTNSPEYKLKKQLEIADKYLAELNYEQAIVAYELALEIDPMSSEAYLGLAEQNLMKTTILGCAFMMMQKYVFRVTGIGNCVIMGKNNLYCIRFLE